MTNISGNVVIAGASGFVGHAATAEFARQGWRVTGLSRSRPAAPVAEVDYLSVDLRDAAAGAAAAPHLAGATHLVYAAVNETPGDLVASWTDPAHAARNGDMFRNLLDVMLDHAPGLRHVSIVHGTKAYGPHIPGWPTPVPLRESLPRPPIDDFYFRQQDYAAMRAPGRFDWTVFRAPIIIGGGRGGNLNNLLAISVFACIRREMGLDLPFPGAADNRGVMEMVDVELLARGLFWAAGAPDARNQVFNIANGDTFVWPDMWPLIAEEIGVASGGHQAMSVRAGIDGHADVWARLVARHNLTAPADPAFLGESGSLADFALGNCQRSLLTSTIKLRQAGFADAIDSADSVRGWIRRWRAEKLLPPR